jgi:hypothetical protein
MKIRITASLCIVLILAAILGFAYSCRVKTEAFKGAETKKSKQPSSSTAGTGVSQSLNPPIHKDPQMGGMGGIVKFQGNTIILPGQQPQAIERKTCQPTGECDIYLQNGTIIALKGDKILGWEEPTSNNPPNPAPTPTPSSSSTKATPGPFTPAPITITCPNGEQSTTGCCANGQPQGKYPCCADGTPSRNGQCK